MHISPTVYVIAAATPWLIVLGRYDWKTRTLPNRLTLGGSAVILAWLLGWGGLPYLLNGLLGGVIAGALLLIAAIGLFGQTQLQAALRELDDALMVALVGAGKGREEKRSYSKTMISCVNSLERELQKGLVVDCGNGSCTLTNEMLKDFSDFSCSVMTGNV